MVGVWSLSVSGWVAVEDEGDVEDVEDVEDEEAAEELAKATGVSVTARARAAGADVCKQSMESGLRDRTDVRGLAAGWSEELAPLLLRGSAERVRRCPCDSPLAWVSLSRDKCPPCVQPDVRTNSHIVLDAS